MSVVTCVNCCDYIDTDFHCEEVTYTKSHDAICLTCIEGEPLLLSQVAPEFQKEIAEFLEV